MNIILICSILMLGCAKQSTVNIDAEIAPYVNEFDARYGGSTNFDVTFVESFLNTKIGECTFSFTNKQIRLSSTFWKASDDWGRRQLVYHELGHCRFNLAHDDAIINGRKVSIMNSEAINSFMFHLYYEQYMIEFDQKILQAQE